MTMEERLEIVERKNRRLTWLVGGLALCALGCAVMGAAWGPEEVSANSFVLIDVNGRNRAELSMMNDDPILIFRDKKGNPSLVLTIQNGPSLAMYDANGFPTIGLTQSQLFLTQKGKGGAFLGLEDGGPLLGLTDSANERIMLRATSSGSKICLKDKKGETKWSAP